MADIWQDDAWREQQRRLLTAQFGPKEVESLSVNAVLPIDVDHAGSTPLQWMQGKELHELQVRLGICSHSPLLQPFSPSFSFSSSSIL